MLEQSVAHYLGNYWRDTPLYAEKIVPLLDYCLSNNYAISDKMSKAFYELIDKYQNTTELPLENMKEFIREQGYDYLVDLFEDREEDLKVAVYLLVLIHHLKGTEKGLRVVLSMFQPDAEPADTVITQWFQETPVGEENTFKITTAKLDVAKAGNNFFQNFHKFVRNYVYPELKSLIVRYVVTAARTHIPVTNITINWTAYGDMIEQEEQI